MGQTLTNGIYLPNEGERNCYSGLAANWNAVDTLKGNYSLHAINVDIHVTAAEKETWNGKADASALTAHTGDTTIHVTAEDKQAWNGKADASALTAHTGDTTIHVTSADKQAWDGHVADTTIHVTSADKQAWDGHVADTTIHVTSADKQAWDGHVADSVKHVTAADKAKWDAVTSKADDSDVVHKSGNETVGGKKTFSDDLTIYAYDSSQATKNLNISSSKIQVGDTSNSDAFGIRFNARASYVAQILAVNDTKGTQNLQLSLRTKDGSDNFITSMIRSRVSANGNSSFEPGTNDSISLGSSVFKWKSVYATNYYYGSNNVEFSTKFVTTDTTQTISGNKTFSSINGVEPSSLSLPSGNVSDIIDISSYITDLSGNVNNYTAPANGWISIAVVGTAIDIVSSSWSDSRLRASSGNVRMLYPVLKNETVSISVVATTLAYARFIPCQGNV